MPKLFSRFLLTPRDVGMEQYTVKEIAELMEPIERVDDSSLYEFAETVSSFLEDDSSSHCKDKSLTSSSS